MDTCSSTCRLLPLKRKLSPTPTPTPTPTATATATATANDDDVSVRVEIEDESIAIRKSLTSQTKSIQDLYLELEEERSSAATAASEAMSMILRLQREKAECQMEFRQFKRLAEEKISHHREEIAALEELLFRKDREILAYRKQFGFGFSILEPQRTDTIAKTGAADDDFDFSPLRCRLRDDHCIGNEYVGETLREKGMIAHSPYEEGVYVVVHCTPESCMSTPRELGRKEVEEEEIRRLYVRLQALEEDREMMRQTITSMGMDKAHLVLLKEIPQQLCKEETPTQKQKQMQVQMQKKKVVRKAWFFSTFLIGSAVKWIASFFSWSKKSTRTKYTFGITSNNVGLLILLDRAIWAKQRQLLTRTSVAY